MSRKILKRTSEKVSIRARRRRRIRATIVGSAERPRLCVTKTNKLLIVQVIDDDKGVTLVHVQSPKKKTVNVTMATELGKQLASAAKAKGIEQVVFDRSGNLYHGRVAALAAGAREAGLKF